jgi:hypothetical protein
MPKNKEVLLWGLGIEAEFALFHNPIKNLLKKTPNLPFFDPQKSFEKPMKRYSYYFYTKPPPKNKSIVYFPSEVQDALVLSDDINVEHAGKLCKGKVVVGKNYDYVYYLLEARTENPFSGKNYGTQKINNYVKELQNNIKVFIKNYTKYRPKYQKDENKIIGKPNYYPYGMSSRINLRNLNTNKFNDGPIIDNYTGSYHFTFTLPHNYPASCKTISNNHKYFANLIQWIEPLIASAYHSCDDRSVGNGNKYTKGSFRMVMASWGNFGGSDVRRIRCVKGKNEGNKEKKSLSRYSTNKVKWRDNLPFKNIELLEPCRDELDLSNAQNKMGSDLRTPYLTIEEKKKKYDLQGLEIRIFDWFDPKYLQSLATILVLVGERSRTIRKNIYVYNNNYWNETVRNIMINGWNSKVPEGYVKELEKVFDIKIKVNSLRAENLFKSFLKSLYQKTKNGKWTKLLLLNPKLPILPKINQKSWELAYVIHLLENKKSYKQLLNFIKNLEKKEYTNKEIKVIYNKNITGSKWKNNFIDILEFLQSQHIIKTKYNYTGDLVSIKVINNKLKSLNTILLKYL